MLALDRGGLFHCWLVLVDRRLFERLFLLILFRLFASFFLRVTVNRLSCSIRLLCICCFLSRKHPINAPRWDGLDFSLFWFRIEAFLQRSLFLMNANRLFLWLQFGLFECFCLCKLSLKNLCLYKRLARKRSFLFICLEGISLINPYI